MNQRLLLLVACAAAFAWAIRNWRKGIEAVMVLLVVEGALRKWVFPGSQQLVYFAKDILLLGCYAGYLLDQRARRFRVPLPPVIAVLLAAAAAWGALEIFNPNLPNILVGVLGFKAYFLYVPLLFVLPACYADDRSVSIFLRRYALLAIPVGLLAVMQFARPSSSAFNAYARGGGDDPYVSTFGSSEFVRVTGTFSYITGFTTYLLASAILLLVLLGASGWRFPTNRKLYVALLFTMLGMLMSGSRGPVFTLALVFPFYWYLAVMRERDAGLTLSRAGLAVAVLAAIVATSGSQAVGAFLGRAAGSTDLASRVTSPLRSPYLLMPDAGVFGFGIGATHQTATAVAPSIIPYSWLKGLITEVETGRVMVELGVVGFVLIYALRLFMIGLAFQYAKTLQTRFHRALATGAFVFFAGELFGAPVFDVTCGVFYWCFAGLMMAAARLDARLRSPSALPVAAASAGRTQPTIPLPQPAGPQWHTRPISG
jgi:hypothetical protein